MKMFVITKQSSKPFGIKTPFVHCIFNGSKKEASVYVKKLNKNARQYQYWVDTCNVISTAHLPSEQQPIRNI